MHAFTHALIGWGVANLAPSLGRRERAIIVIGSIIPDLDAASILGGPEAFAHWHRTLCHNVLFAAVTTALAAAFARERRGTVAALFALNFHLHLLCDFLGSAAPDGTSWGIPYLLPFDRWRLDNPHQWALNAWPNFAITFAFFALAVWIARRWQRTPLEPISLRADAAVLEVLRRRLKFDAPPRRE